jgi:alpha-beta hydrolase superfamily lysophospholipase
MGPSMTPTEIVSVETSDGWTCELRRYQAGGPPVVLVHGMGANHYNFDFAAPVSLAQSLQDGGYDVWIVPLRGDPGCEAPSRRASRSISFDDYVRYDLPAAVDTVLARSGHEQLGWVGHSLGGMLLYAWLGQAPETVFAGVAVGSPAAFPQPPSREATARLVGMLPPRGNLPVVAMMRGTAWMGRHHPSYDRLANPENLEPDTLRGLARHAMSDIPVPLAHQARTWAREGAITSLDGTRWVPAESGAAVPLLVAGGPMDHVVGEGNVRVACEIFPDCRYVRLAEEDGFGADYGHIDPMLGVRAREEVYPVIVGFLDEKK